MWALWSEMVSDKGRGHFSDEGGMHVDHGGPMVPSPTCAFYHIWIPHYAHIAESLYGLLKKGLKFEWGEEHLEVMQRLKGMLTEALVLRKAVYGKESPIYVTVDMSPTGIGWVINQEDGGDTRCQMRVYNGHIHNVPWTI